MKILRQLLRSASPGRFLRLTTVVGLCALSVGLWTATAMLDGRLIVIALPVASLSALWLARLGVEVVDRIRDDALVLPKPRRSRAPGADRIQAHPAAAERSGRGLADPPDAALKAEDARMRTSLVARGAW